VRDLPRTETNLAAFLVDEVGKPVPIEQVKAALERLKSAQFIRTTDDGWKLQTAQEKSWDTERRGYLDPKPREQNDIRKRVLQQVFDEAEFKTYRYQTYRTFRVGISVDGMKLGDEGDLGLSLCIAEDGDDLNKRLTDIREESRQKSHENELYWLFALTPEIDELVRQLRASRKIVEIYDQLRAHNKINTEEATCLRDEKTAALSYQSQLRDKLNEAMEKGSGMFRGVQKDAATLGNGLSEILKKLFAYAVPFLYPKLEMGARPLKGDEAEQILKVADLKALPTVFAAGENGLALVVKEGPKNVIDTAAPIAKEILDYLKSEHPSRWRIAASSYTAPIELVWTGAPQSPSQGTAEEDGKLRVPPDLVFPDRQRKP
jgi:hypothetical protein